MASPLNTKHCWICNGAFADPFPVRGDTVEIDCTTCGQYVITGSIYASRFPLPDSERFRFSYWNKMRQLEGREPLRIDSTSLSVILPTLPNPPTHEKSKILLLSLTRLHPIPGQRFQIDAFREYSLACARDLNELQFYARGLIQDAYLESNPKVSNTPYLITHAGWDAAAKLAVEGPISKTAFVAMRFKDDMLALWAPVFSEAIKHAGFEPRLASDPVHNDRIDAKIVADIRQSRFVVADVTWGSQGVYFEAGYALALGRPVIWTCRRDREKDDMHFDTRQYNHILWDGPDDLRDQLYYRIAATI